MTTTREPQDNTVEKTVDKAQYLEHYKDMLNKYGGRSFYNMTGFGDISVLALLKTQEAANGAANAAH